MRMNVMVLGAVVAASACGVNESNIGTGGDDSSADSAALSSTSRTFVGVRADENGAGYWVHDVNRVNLSETLVSGLDFTGSNLGDADQGIVFEALEETVLHGKLGPKNHDTGLRPFIVSEAFRGMPGKTPAAGDAFYKITDVQIECLVAPCPSMSAVRVNYAPTKLFHVLSLDGIGGFVDTNWLNARATNGGAVTSGTLTKSGQSWTLAASNVYVQLPERTSCPQLAAPRCTNSSQQRSYTRSPDRCILPSDCVNAGPCSQLLPGCSDGYTAVSWKGAPNACNKTVCDPSWLHE